MLEKDASILAAYDSMGYVHYKRGDHASAKACYEKILELDPKNKKALNSLEILAKSA